MTPAPATRRTLPLVEIALLLAVLAGFAASLESWRYRGYLPQPFIFNPDDTFMDWFNTAYFAHNPGAYDVWQSVYPPLSFVFLKVFGLSGCYRYSPLYARDCDWVGRAAISGFYLLDVALVFIAFRRNDRATGWVRGIAFALGLPLLFTLERGNLILPCFTGFIVAHGGVAQRKGIARYLGIAATINFKPYLLLPALALAFRRDWRRLELAGLATLGLYLVTLALFGSGTIAQLLRNTINWTQFTGMLVWEQVYYSTSFAPFLDFDVHQFPIRDFLTSRYADAMMTAIPIAIRSSQILALVCLAGAWLQPRALPLRRISFLLLGMSLIAQSPGGYTETFLLFLVFLERWERPGPKLALVATYLLCIPYDWMLGNFWSITVDSWLSGRIVDAAFGLAVGTLARPLLIIVILWALALDSLYLIARAHRVNRPTIAIAPGLPTRLAT